jgi:signal transduction histidine kinase
VINERVLRVLLIEDSEDDAHVVLATLAAGGFSVVSKRVENGEQLQQTLERDSWDLVISDFSLPGFGAMEALDIFRRHEVHAPLVLVTGAIGEESAAAVIKAGATDLVMKQGLHRLLPVVERALREQESLRQYRLAIEALNESEARFQAIAANLPGVVYQAILYADGTADFAYVSEGSQLVLGVPSDALMSNPGILLDMILPEDRPSFIEGRIKTATQLVARNWEGRVRVPLAGDIKWVNLRASVRKLPSGVVLSDGIISNITESKIAQEAIHESQRQLRQLASHVERVKEHERGNMAREIHDDLGGTLTAAKIDLAWIRSRLPVELPALVDKVDAMDGLLDYAIAATQRISRSLRPLVLDYGVAAAIEWQIKEFRRRMGVPCDFFCTQDEILLDPEFSTALFRIFQETLTNISKHAQASRVDVILEDTGDEVLLIVTDDGKGIDSGDMQKSQSYGIRGIRERTAALGGTVEISGAPGAGTQVRVVLPAKRPAAAPRAGEAVQ